MGNVIISKKDANKDQSKNPIRTIAIIVSPGVFFIMCLFKEYFQCMAD